VPAAPVPTSTSEVYAALKEALHYPDNVGLTVRHLRLPAEPSTRVLMLYFAGLADEAQVRDRAFEILEGVVLTSATAPGKNVLLPETPASAWAHTERELPAVIGHVVRGETALFFDGARHVVVVETARHSEHPAGTAQVYPPRDLFSRHLIGNLALLRTRLRDPHLVAEPIHRSGEEPGQTVLVYINGRADPEVLRRVRERASSFGEERIRQGHLAGPHARFGLIPAMVETRWPDKAATALKEGYVAVLADQVYMTWLAPVTAPLLLYGPMDETIARPIASVLRLGRLFVAITVLVAMPTIVALMNYHQEMMPTPFMLALAAVRENSPLPILFEVMVVEGLQELIREVGFHLPLRISPGTAVVAGILLMLVLVQSGFIGPLPGVVSAAMAFATTGIQQYDTIYVLRLWRLAMLFGAGALGFYGMAVVLFFMAVYLYQTDSFGVPFISETGIRFSAPELVSSWLKRRKEHGEVRHLR